MYYCEKKQCIYFLSLIFMFVWERVRWYNEWIKTYLLDLNDFNNVKGNRFTEI